MVKFFKNAKRLRLKIASMILLVVLLTLEFSPFAVKATANQLQVYAPGAVSVGWDSYNGKSVFYSNSTLGGTTAYCIDYTFGIPSGTMTFRDYLSDQGLAILIHGYPNCSPASLGCNTEDEAYMATQMALWEVLNRTGESHKAGLIFRVENVTPKAGMEGFYQRSVAAAKKLVAMAESDPYTDVPTLTVTTQNATLSYIGDDALMGPYKVDVTGVDKSNVRSITATLENAPASARITDAQGNTKTSVSNGDSVYVRMSSSEAKTSFRLVFASDVDRKVGCIYTQSAATQDYVRLDTVPNSMSQPITINWTPGESYGRIEITKVDDTDKPVAGAKFRLERADGTVIAEEVETGVDGKIIFTNVPVGEYVLIETEAPKGYAIIDSTTNVTVKKAETTYVEVVNERVRGTIIVVKTDDEETPIEGVKFNIMNDEREVIQTITTDADGLAGVTDLPLGTYYYQEIEAPENVIMDTGVYKLELENKGQVLRVDVVNVKIKGSLKITKVDDKNTPIANVKFDILDSNKNVVDTIETDKNGVAVSKELTPGTYYYKEIEVPDGYIMDSTEYKFDINNEGELKSVKVVNYPEKGKLKITKYDNKGSTLEGVKFDILDENKNVVDTIITDENGVAISKDLPVGTYYYKETEAPENVVMDEAEHEFILNENNQVIQKTVVNKLVEKGKLQITKYDSNGSTLEGVKFDILDENKNVVDTIITDENGVAISKDLPIGTYYYKETEAPENVVMDEEEHEFILTEDNQVVQKTVINEIQEGKLKIIKVDENSEPLAGVKFEIYDENMNFICDMTTNEEGIAESEELEKGTYYYKEVEAPEGIVIDEEPHKFTIEYDGQNVVENVVNNFVKGKLQITKLVDGTNTPLKDVKFAILDSERNVIEEIITDENGIATSSNLTYGTYYFKEIEAPDGYIIDGQEHEFSIVENNDLVEAVVYNKKAELPQTGGLLSDDMMIVLAVSAISILGYVVVRAISSKKEEC